jgi:hypothetical protein
MKLRSKGPFTAVEIAATGQVVPKGGTVDIEDAAVAEGLLAQEDTWTKAAPPSSSKSPKKTTSDKGD